MIKVVPPPGEGIKLVRPAGNGDVALVGCHGVCSDSLLTPNVGTAVVEWTTTPSSRFNISKRSNKRYPLKLELFCTDASGAERPIGTLNLTLAFDRFGTLSYERSDLNGDGEPDGKQLR
jgi:hypothetical protein